MISIDRPCGKPSRHLRLIHRHYQHLLMPRSTFQHLPANGHITSPGIISRLPSAISIKAACLAVPLHVEARTPDPPCSDCGHPASLPPAILTPHAASCVAQASVPKSFVLTDTSQKHKTLQSTNALVYR